MLRCSGLAARARSAHITIALRRPIASCSGLAQWRVPPSAAAPTTARWVATSSSQPAVTVSTAPAPAAVVPGAALATPAPVTIPLETTSAPLADPPADGRLSTAMIGRLNEAIALYPLETLVSLAVLEGTTFTITKALFLACDVHFPTMFAVAFVLSMPLRRSMLPKLTIALPLAMALRKLAPRLAQVHLSAIWKNRAAWMPFSRTKAPNAVDSKPSLGARLAAFQTKLPTWLQWRKSSVTSTSAPSFGDRLTSLSDSYGLTLLISYRMAGCVIVNGVYLALTKGVDITPLLTFCGFTGDATQPSVLGAYAGAVVFGSVWFPLTVFLAPYPAKLIWLVRQRLRRKTAAPTPASISAATPTSLIDPASIAPKANSTA